MSQMISRRVQDPVGERGCYRGEDGWSSRKVGCSGKVNDSGEVLGGEIEAIIKGMTGTRRSVSRQVRECLQEASPRGHQGLDTKRDGLFE